jgi:hypothetical protein
MTVTVDDSAGTGRAISNDVTAVQIGMPSTVQDITGVNSTGMERLLLLADLSITLTGVFNDVATTGIHTVLSTFRTLAASQTGRTTVIVVSGDTLTNEVLYTDYQLNRAADGSLVVTAPGGLSNGTLSAWA